MKHIILVFLALLFCSPACAGTLNGKVVGVHDGDTVTLLSPDKASTKIRLAQIDAPELAQPYGQNAKQALSALVFGKEVEIRTEAIDRYGRTVGTIYINGKDMNAEMVATGNAWYYSQYGHDPKLQGLEDNAKAQKLGLWALQKDQIQSPWAYRHDAKTGQSQPAAIAAAPSANDNQNGFSCSGKTKCAQMSSCAEARYYLTKCGLTRIDGDHDGIPCESICK